MLKRNRAIVVIGSFAILILLLKAGYLKNSLENFFFWLDLGNNSRVLESQEKEDNLANLFFKAKPIKRRGAGELNLVANSAISVLLNDGREQILFSKDAARSLPIASLTKLVSAAVVLENYDLDKIVKVSKEAVGQEEDFGQLEVGERLSIKSLLYLMLIESSNDAAYALAQEIGVKNFIGMMQEKAENLGMKNTFFVDDMGLDPDEKGQPLNYSSVKDLVLLVKHLLGEPVIWGALSSKNYVLYGPNGQLHHILKNTNELLEASDPWAERIIGGKTGFTSLSNGCLILVLEAPKGRGIIINIILGSDDRFGEMKQLVDWVNKAYIW